MLKEQWIMTVFQLGIARVINNKSIDRGSANVFSLHFRSNKGIGKNRINQDRSNGKLESRDRNRSLGTPKPVKEQ